MAAPNSPATDIAAFLASNSIGSQGSTSNWGIFIGRDPTDPEATISVYDIGGLDPNAKLLLDWPQVQVRVRGAKDAYSAAYTKMQAIKDLLLGRGPTTINSTSYVGFWMLSDIIFVGYTEEHPIFTINFQLAREPVDTTQRESI